MPFWDILSCVLEFSFSVLMFELVLECIYKLRCQKCPFALNKLKAHEHILKP